jgi:hypothetical protein
MRRIVMCFRHPAQYANRRIAEGFRLADTPAANAAAARAVGLDPRLHHGVALD